MRCWHHQWYKGIFPDFIGNMCIGLTGITLFKCWMRNSCISIISHHTAVNAYNNAYFKYQTDWWILVSLSLYNIDYLCRKDLNLIPNWSSKTTTRCHTFHEIALVPFLLILGLWSSWKPEMGMWDIDKFDMLRVLLFRHAEKNVSFCISWNIPLASWGFQHNFSKSSME